MKRGNGRGGETGNGGGNLPPVNFRSGYTTVFKWRSHMAEASCLTSNRPVHTTVWTAMHRARHSVAEQPVNGQTEWKID